MIKHIIFLDDDSTQNFILSQNMVKNHQVSKLAKFDFFSSSENLEAVFKSIKLDLVVFDYFLAGATSKSLAAMLRFRQPDCARWLYSGYDPSCLAKADLSLFDKCIKKENLERGLEYLLDEITIFLRHEINIVEIA